MHQEPFDQEQGSAMLMQIREGMTVYDRDNDKVGTVERVYFGATSQKAHEVGQGAATADSPDMRGDSLIEEIAEALAPGDDIPEALRNRLLHHGFIRLDAAGLFAADRYVLPEQIASVSGDRVLLRVSRAELVKS